MLSTDLAQRTRYSSGCGILVDKWGVGTPGRGNSRAKALRREWAFAAEDHEEAGLAGVGR